MFPLVSKAQQQLWDMPLEENVSFSTSSLVGPESHVIKGSVSLQPQPLFYVYLGLLSPQPD